MYIYRVQKAFEEFDVRITDEEALEFQKIYADRQHHIHMSPQMSVQRSRIGRFSTAQDGRWGWKMGEFGLWEILILWMWKGR